MSHFKRYSIDQRSYDSVIIRLFISSSGRCSSHARWRMTGASCREKWVGKSVPRRGSRAPAPDGSRCGVEKGRAPFHRAACRRLTYEALVTPRFCAVDSNSTRHGRNRRGFKKKERKTESGGGRATERRREGDGRKWQSRTGKRG